MQFQYFPDRKKIPVKMLMLLFPAFASEYNNTNPSPQYSTKTSLRTSLEYMLHHTQYRRFPSISMQFIFQYFSDRKKIPVKMLMLLFPAFVSECNHTNPSPQYSTTT